MRPRPRGGAAQVAASRGQATGAAPAGGLGGPPSRVTPAREARAVAVRVTQARAPRRTGTARVQGVEAARPQTVVAWAPRARPARSPRAVRTATSAPTGDADGAARGAGVAIAGSNANGPVAPPPLPVAFAPVPQATPRTAAGPLPVGTPVEVGARGTALKAVDAATAATVLGGAIPA